MSEFYRQYLAVGVFVVAAMGMVAAMLGVGSLLRPGKGKARVQPQKSITYESGSDPLGGFGQMTVRYYIYALLFVIFDVEAVFVFPWAIQAESLSWFGIVEIFVFIAVLLVGLAYLWRKGLLTWA